MSSHLFYIFIVTLMLIKSTTSSNGLGFIVIGDWGGKDSPPYYKDAQVKAAAGMSKVATDINANFIMALGDNFYYDGVEESDSTRFADTWEQVYITPYPSLQKPWYICAGNHDWHGNVSAQIEYSKTNQYWKFPDFNYDWVETFTNDKGETKSIQFVMIDTILLTGNTAETDPEDVNYFQQPTMDGWTTLAKQNEIVTYLEQILSQSTADFILVSGHYPVYSPCKHGNTDSMHKTVKPLLEQYNAHYLCGHDHCLAHANDEGVEYVLSGMADECCYEAPPKNIESVKNLDFMVALGHNPTKAVSGFTSITSQIEDGTDSLKVEYHDQDGNVLFTKSLAMSAHAAALRKSKAAAGK